MPDSARHITGLSSAELVSSSYPSTRHYRERGYEQSRENDRLRRQAEWQLPWRMQSNPLKKVAKYT